MATPAPFAWYAAWNAAGAALVLLLVPETRARTLEELDAVFAVPMGAHARWRARLALYWVRRCVLRQRRHANGAALVPPRLYSGGSSGGSSSSSDGEGEGPSEADSLRSPGQMLRVEDDA